LNFFKFKFLIKGIIMIGALWTGISGLAAQQTALDNESHNIANVNTVGYKASRITFADQMYQNNIGKGTQVVNAEKMYTQGNLKLTGVNYDMALSGDGFFTVETVGSGTSETYYTRAGNFRMGDTGTLQDSLGNNVVGWAIRPEQEVISSDPNNEKFTNNYTKLLASRIINYPTSVETITAKATDYNATSQSDNLAVYSGAGLKDKYSKITDIEALITNYNTRLKSYQADPTQSSINSISQVTTLDLTDYNDPDGTAISQEGDEVFVYIDGTKYAQEYKSGVDAEEGYIKTMKAFADTISKVPGLKAYTTEAPDANGNYKESTDDGAVKLGILKIESMIPGKSYNISSTGMVHGGTNKPGVIETPTKAIEGQGKSALDSATKALEEAISGKQRDVYTEDTLNLAGTDDVKYTISIYDKEQEKVIELPTLTITDPASIDDIVTAINGDADYAEHLEAQNINGYLVITTKDENFEVDYSGKLEVGANLVKRDTELSGWEGAGAEFLQMKTEIDQSATKSPIQLRLDTLNISDSAFGDFKVDNTGLITMSQDGATFAVGQVAVAKFITNRGLEPVGNNLLKSTLASGDPIYNLNNDKTADIQGNTLELSTADLSESLVNLMVFQRAFEANAKSITTADTILNTLIQLKR
jgi:flagellar hook protein FlgE